MCRLGRRWRRCRDAAHRVDLSGACQARARIDGQLPNAAPPAPPTSITEAESTERPRRARSGRASPPVPCPPPSARSTLPPGRCRSRPLASRRPPAATRRPRSANWPLPTAAGRRRQLAPPRGSACPGCSPDLQRAGREAPASVVLPSAVRLAALPGPATRSGVEEGEPVVTRCCFLVRPRRGWRSWSRPASSRRRSTPRRPRKPG